MKGRRRQAISVNDRMQSGYRYERVAPIGRNFHPEFRPELTPKQMLELRSLLRKIPDGCAEGVPHLVVHTGQADAALPRLLPQLFWRRCQSTAFSVAQEGLQFIPTIRAHGSNGIAATTWAGECQKRMRDRSGARTLCAAMWRKSNATANTVIRPAESARGRPPYTGPMTAEKSEGL